MKWRRRHTRMLKQVLFGVSLAGALVLLVRRLAADDWGAGREVIDLSPGAGGVWEPAYPLTARVTGYYPVGPGASQAERRQEGGNVDRKSRPLYSLQQFLAGQAPYVSVAVDPDAFPVYGEELRIKELEERYGRRLVFRAVDTGEGLIGKGTGALDVRVDTKADAYAITGPVHYARPEAPEGTKTRDEVA